ncbi:unnamed protein product [Urochloa humidicola]
MEKIGKEKWARKQHLHGATPPSPARVALDRERRPAAQRGPRHPRLADADLRAATAPRQRLCGSRTAAGHSEREKGWKASSRVAGLREVPLGLHAAWPCEPIGRLQRNKEKVREN